MRVLPAGFKVLSLIAFDSSFAHGGIPAYVPVGELPVLLYEHLNAHEKKPNCNY